MDFKIIKINGKIFKFRNFLFDHSSINIFKWNMINCEGLINELKKLIYQFQHCKKIFILVEKTNEFVFIKTEFYYFCLRALEYEKFLSKNCHDNVICWKEDGF